MGAGRGLRREGVAAETVRLGWRSCRGDYYDIRCDETCIQESGNMTQNSSRIELEEPQRSAWERLQAAWWRYRERPCEETWRDYYELAMREWEAVK